MKNLSRQAALRAALVALSAAVIVPALGARAHADATIRLVGQMPPRASLLLGNGTTLATVNLTANSSQVLFNLDESSNGGEGYTISVVSANVNSDGEPLLTSEDGGAPVPYQLTYDGVPLQFQDGAAVIKTLSSSNQGDGSGNVAFVPLGTGAPGASYTDTLQFVIIAK